MTQAFHIKNETDLRSVLVYNIFLALFIYQDRVSGFEPVPSGMQNQPWYHCAKRVCVVTDKTFNVFMTTKSF